MANTAINHDPVATFPGSSTNTAVVKWSGTSGNALLDSGVIIDGSNNVTGLNNVTATGYLHLTGDEKELRFYEGANYIAIKTNASLAANYTFTLPLNDGSADEFLQTNGSGVLTWAAAAGTTINSNADNRVITGSGTANTLNGESSLTYDGTTLSLSADAVIQNGYGIVIGHTGVLAAADHPGNTVGEFTMIGAAGGDTGVHIIRHAADAGGGAIRFAKSRNATVGSHTIVQDDDTIGEISFFGDDGGDLEPFAAQIRVRVDGTPGTNDMPGRIEFSTTADGAETPTERMRISSTDVTVLSGSSMVSVSQGVAKAWVQFKGTSTVTVYGSYGVTDITDNTTGDYAVNWSTNMSSANYAVAAVSHVDQPICAIGQGNGIRAQDVTVATGSNASLASGSDRSDSHRVYVVAFAVST